MNFSAVVEVTNVFPGPIGGCTFWGIAEGSKRSSPFKVKYDVGIRNPCVGELWKVKGQIRPYDQYNKQVVVNNAAFQGLPKNDYIVKFLGVHPKFRGFGFGEKGAIKLVGDIGVDELIKLLNNGDWKTIADAISESKAQRICEEWRDLKEETELITFLTENKLDVDLARQIIRLCKFDTVERLKRNPYALVALSNSKPNTLMTIASVAKAQEINSDDERALIGCVEFALYQELQRSHTITKLCMATESIKTCLDMIGSKKSAEIAIKVALAAKTICILEDYGTIYLQPISLAYIEQSVEKALTLLHKTPIQDDLLASRSQLMTRIERYSIDHKIHHGWGLVAKQCESVEMALTNRVSLLSGYGGTGKTAVLKAIYDLASEMGIVVHVAALSGKAANRAKQSIKADEKKVSTIHTMIKLIEDGNRFSVDISSDPLLIIDESSMVDISLICKLIKLFKGYPFRLLLVGDSAQLPPIGFGLFWHKLVESNAPHTRLTEVHRMLAGSPLHQCAMKIRNGLTHELPIYQGELEGVYLMPNVTDFTSAIVKLRNTFDHCMVLTSYASGRFQSSTKTLNPQVQARVNPLLKGEFLMRYGTTILHRGDPVLATKNAHNMGIFNGMTGVIDSIVVDSGKITCHVKFDDDLRVNILSQEDCWEIGLQLAYLITIHKSQGSEYDNCAILIDSPYLERSGIYTALTRTKKLCILIGTNEQYNNAIRRPPSFSEIRSGFAPIFEHSTRNCTELDVRST
ncbi:MAG: exodeoxyribonuclease V alpha subunit [Cognaticolwellia sp.]|jgi:exodeoxyribonuclease V alpha subunit